MDDWIKLNATIDYQNFWSPRNTAEDAELIHLSKTGKYLFNINYFGFRSE